MFKTNAKKYVLTVLAALLIVVSHYAGLLRPIESFLSKIMNPAFRIFYSFAADANKIYSDKSSKKDLPSELSKSMEEIRRLTAENVRLRFLKEENAELRRQLNFLDKSKRRYLMANIISREGLAGNSGNNMQSVIIDKGAEDGLSAGLAVVSAADVGAAIQGIIIGKITSVKDHISEIRLATDKNSKFAASILGENKTSGVASGELGLTIKMNFIPRTENIKQGDIVATSGLEKNIQAGLAIGRISFVSKENNEVWQSADIEPLVDFDSLSVVSVLLP